MGSLSPLGKWLRANKVSQREFARILGESRETSVHQSQISEWATGALLPKDATLIDIEVATGGEVPRESWPCFHQRRAEREAKARARAAV